LDGMDYFVVKMGENVEFNPIGNGVHSMELIGYWGIIFKFCK